MTGEGRQLVRFLFLKLDPAWRRLPAAEQMEQRREYVGAVHDFRARLLLRAYSLIGTRGDADLLLWQAADDLDTLQQFHTALLSTRLGAFLDTPYSFLGLTRRSAYELAEDREARPRVRVSPQDTRYLFVYPFEKSREWYALPAERRRELMEAHIRTARGFPGVRSHTVYSFGLDDQEFVVAFEADEPAEFVELVLALRETAASAYTRRDTPVFTCLQMSLAEALEALGGARSDTVAAGGPSAPGPEPVASLAELRDGEGRRVYRGGDAVALFRVGERVFAVSDRCPHGRASLSEGSVDAAACRLRCPWHDALFDLETGRPLAGPARAALTTYRVRIDGEHVYLA